MSANQTSFSLITGRIDLASWRVSASVISVWPQLLCQASFMISVMARTSGS